MAKVMYNVKISRIRNDWFEPKYKWEVEVHENPGNQNQNYELRGFGLTFTENKARKTALKHIEKVQKGLDKNIKYGVIYSNMDSYENIKKAFK